jgi:tRNA (guanine-N7-)-methyltransferase
VGTHRPGAHAEGGTRPLISETEAGGGVALKTAKPPPERLYGRSRGHKLRARQELLLQVTLPRLRFGVEHGADPKCAFDPIPDQLWLEIGFGGGEHALAQISDHPRTGLIACEVFENGICSLLSRLVPEGAEAGGALPKNLRLWPDDARPLLRMLPDACLDRIFLLFPDPWPKARHAKRRFVHPDIIPLLARVLKPHGDWRVASDDPTYQGWVTEVMAAQGAFVPSQPSSVRPEEWPPTRYEAKALRAGRTPFYWRFVKQDPPAES